MSRADELGRLEQELGVLIRRVKRVIGERARAVHPDLQPASYLMLTFLAADGPQRSSVVSERFNVDKGAISRQVQHRAISVCSSASPTRSTAGRP